MIFWKISISELLTYTQLFKTEDWVEFRQIHYTKIELNIPISTPGKSVRSKNQELNYYKCKPERNIL